MGEHQSIFGQPSGSDEGLSLQDASVLLVRDVQELADVIHVGHSHCFAVVFENEIAFVN